MLTLTWDRDKNLPGENYDGFPLNAQLKSWLHMYSAVIAGSVSTGVVILALLVFIAVSLCVFLISKRNRKYKKTGHEVERVYPDAVEDDEHDVETDRVKRTPVHTSDEQERLLRQCTTVLRDAKK